MRVLARRRMGSVNQSGRGQGRSGARGFTLTELLIAMGIAAILMLIVVPSFFAITNQQRQTTCAANLKAIGQALAIFHADYGCYPPDSTEYLWTPSAQEQYRQENLNQSPPNYRFGTLTDAAYYPNGEPFETGMHGLGLFTLYYIGAYATVLPPRSSDPRFPRPEDEDYPPEDNDPMRLRSVKFDKGYNQFEWFRGGGYITKLSIFHCPGNDATYQQGDLLDHRKLPGLGTWDNTEMRWTTAWNNYDQWYRRNWWTATPGLRPGPEDDKRNLWEAHPPLDTVVTWCPHHRQAGARNVVTGDRDFVLFVDGSVRRMTSRKDNRMYDASLQDAGWPEGPVM